MLSCSASLRAARIAAMIPLCLLFVHACSLSYYRLPTLGEFEFARVPDSNRYQEFR